MRRTRDRRNAERSVPNEGDLAQRLLVEHFDTLGDIAAAGTGIEGDCVRVLFERPDHEAVQAVRLEPAARFREQPRPESDSLAFGAQVELVDLAFLLQFASAVAADRGVAGYLAANLDDEHGRRTADGIRPPLG